LERILGGAPAFLSIRDILQIFGNSQNSDLRYQLVLGVSLHKKYVETFHIVIVFGKLKIENRRLKDISEKGF
jgi:hypothetical protein